MVEWIGPEGSDKPASVTKVNEGTEDHGHGTSAEELNPTNDVLNLPLYLSIAALIVAIISLLISLRKKLK